MQHREMKKILGKFEMHFLFLFLLRKKEKRNYFVFVFAPVQKLKTISFLSFVLIQKKQKIKKQQAVRAQNDFAPLIRE
jgi:hypothetical protein